MREKNMPDKIICYCFGHTESAIRNEVRDLGHSRIMEKIMAAKSQGDCQCKEKNPKGC